LISGTASVDNLLVYRQPEPIFQDGFVSSQEFRWSEVVGAALP
jgi:hypothetical protein